MKISFTYSIYLFIKTDVLARNTRGRSLLCGKAFVHFIFILSNAVSSDAGEIECEKLHFLKCVTE